LAAIFEAAAHVARGTWAGLIDGRPWVDCDNIRTNTDEGTRTFGAKRAKGLGTRVAGVWAVGVGEWARRPIDAIEPGATHVVGEIGGIVGGIEWIGDEEIASKDVVADGGLREEDGFGVVSIDEDVACERGRGERTRAE